MLSAIAPNVAIGKFKKRYNATDKTSTFSTQRQADAENELAGTGYEDLVSSNPYENFEYQNGIWDRIGDVFGFRTGQDKYREDMALASGEFLSQVQSLKREEEYNSESSKVARMRAAGLNPDLQGIGDASSASEFSEPETSPESPSSMNGADAAGFALDFGSSIVGGISTIGNFLLTLEHQSLVNEGLAYENAGVLIDVINAGGTTFDMPDISDSDSSESVEGVELASSKVESGRIEVLANSLFGSKSSRAKSNFIRGMRARQGTLSALNTHLAGEVDAAVGKGDLNVAKASLAGRKSVSNSQVIEDALLRCVLNDALHKANIAEINRKFSSDNADLIEQGLVNQATFEAEQDPHKAAVAANAGFVADTASAGAEVDEARARSKEAALADEQARYELENYHALEELYEKWKSGTSSQRRKYHRQIRQKFGYGPVNEPSTGMNVGATGSASASRRSSFSNVVRKSLK